MAEQSIFISLLDRMKRGSTSRPLANEKTVINGNQVTPNSNPIQQKQQQFLDVQSNKIAQDIYSRSVYYDTDRLGAYADFRAMDMSPEVSAALDIITDECLEASTLIPLLDGTNKTIEELYNSNFKNFYVYSINLESGQVEPSICEKVIYKGEQDVYEIKFDDDSTVLATSEHLWLSKKSNEYKTTKNLKEGDSIEPFKNESSPLEENVESNNNVKSITYLEKRKTYDLANVGEYHNFAILTSNGKTGFFSHNCVTRNERGDILSIYSENQRIKTVLKDLFKNRLNIEYNLTFWIREMVKFGDTFIKLELDQKEGIYDCRMLPVSEMHREEAFDGNVNTSRFKWDINNMYFEEFQMAHFRLISDGTKIPYGRSVLDSARKLWKQLQLAEDAMLVYRIVRAPERRVHYIEVGNLEPGDVQQYIEKIKRELKKAPIVDQKTGQVNLKYNPMPVWKETPIPLLDGRTITIEELAKEYNEGKENFVYSVQDDTHKVVPGKVVWCGMNYTAKQLTKVWLDDNTWVLTAPEHPFVMRDGRHVRADELKERDSLMPFYVGEDKKIYNPENGKYEYVNNLIYLEEKESSNINTEKYEYENHKVLRIENVEVKGEDVYCMTVKGLQNEDDRHNFAMFSFDLNGNNSGSGIFVRNTLEEDYFLPIRGDKSSRIESLPGACLALDTKIELLDGRSLELNEIIEEYKQGKDLWSYSINPETGEIVPGQITWAGVTRKDAEVLKITLDNGETITTTIDHKFPTKFNGIKEAKDLEVGESLWSFNKKFEKIKGAGKKRHRNTYEMIYDHEIKQFKYTHRMVANYFKNLNEHEEMVHLERLKEEGKTTIHHKDFNRYNNLNSNLCFMDSKDHFYYHQDNYKAMCNFYGEEKIEEWKESRREGIKKYWENITEEERENKKEACKENIKKATARVQELLLTDKEFKKEFYLKTGKGIKKVKNTPEAKAAQGALARGYWKDEKYRNAVIEKQTIKYSDNMLKYVADKYREGLTANSILECINKENSEFIIEFNYLNEGNEQLKKMVNGFTHNNLYKMVKHFGYENWRDFKNKFEFFNHKIVSIEFLSERQDTGTITIDGPEKYHNFHNFALTVGVFTQNSNLSEISDVEYLQNKLFSALKVPKPYLNYAESMPGGSTLSQADLRFSRTINRIQENVIIELRRIANIHLFLLGFEDDMDNFDLKLTNPSTQQELLKLETMKARLEVFKEIFTNEATSPVSYTWAMEYIMGFSKAEIKQILRQKKVEKKMFSEIDSAPEEYNATGLFKEIDDKFQKTTGNLGQADASGAGGEEMSAASGGGTTDMDAGGASFGGESAFGGGNELPTSEPEATIEEPSAEPLAENLLFENETNNDLIESLFENQNKKLNTKTQRLVDSITERLNKINEETNSDEENDSLNSGNFDSNVL